MSTILKLIRKNLSLELIRHKYDGKIFELLYEDFKVLKWFNFRMNFSLFDYENRCLSKNFATFKPTIWLTSISWMTIFLSIFMIIYPSNSVLIDLTIYEKMLNSNRSDLILIQIVVTFIILELLWIVFLIELLTYRSPLLSFLTIYLPNYEHKMDVKMRKILIKFQAFANFAITFSYLNVIAIMTIIGVIVPFLCFELYMKNQINFIKFFTSIPFVIIIDMVIIFITGQLFVSGKWAYFSLIFFKERIKRLHNVSLLLIHYSHYSMERIFTNQFCHKYISLYSEIYRINQTAKIVLFALETLSKSAIMIAVVFYTCLPSYNERCVQNLHHWLIRSQFHSKFKPIIRWRQSMKANLFVQAMVNNRFGFTCGPLFHINKYKFFEMLLMNISWIILFHKQMCLNHL
ncbi:hypothetical protein HUG17_9150 [Dermatophagoides farinae]|uniref:Uncharacterized protein n=1 Tax=Dermatophagoides farinae TaxID=6954 RepID=A0A9D4NUL5_DERFA|nr:hypothetical protein HUG17_9150 [Dermatophagoides farinae]